MEKGFRGLRLDVKRKRRGEGVGIDAIQNAHLAFYCCISHVDHFVWL